MADPTENSKFEGNPVFDAKGNEAGVTDPTDGKIEPSPQIAKPGEGSAPTPKGGPIVTAKQIKLDKWTLYAEGDNLYARSPNGTILQMVMFDPKGITQKDPPNKLSDGSDGSKGSIGGNNVPFGSQITSAEGTPANAPVRPSDTVGPTVPATVVALPSILPIGLNLPSILFNSLFQPSFYPDIRSQANAQLGRQIDDIEWANLIAASYAESGGDPRETAWIAGTILNRARDSGMNVSAILNQLGQFRSVTGFDVANPAPVDRYLQGPPATVEQRVYQSLRDFLPEVPRNNYWYNSVDPAVAPDKCVVTTRDGIQGILVGQSLVYPGVRWNP
jgi:hypothetical protein